MTESAAGTAVTTTAADPTPAQKLSAEVVGTFVLVFFGVGTALATGADVITTGLAFGLTVLVMVYSVGPRLRRPLQPGGHGRAAA